MKSLLFLALTCGLIQAAEPRITLEYKLPHWLNIRCKGQADIGINYLEAYCRAGSTDADWSKHTTIPHTVENVAMLEDKTFIHLREKLADGVTTEHKITAGADEVSFHISLHNPTAKASEAHWAQPCIRLGDFTGFTSKEQASEDYLPKCFIELEGKLTRMDRIRPWVKEARYIPGQVWCPLHVPRSDVNPRPLSPLVPSSGIIGCESKDKLMLFAVAFAPYQELFQGVARCLHADFRIAGLQPGETKAVMGKMYFLPNDEAALQARYAKDFRETP